jgi:hypothetical protein
VLLLLFLLRVVVRNQWLASGLFIVLLAAINSANSGFPWTDVPVQLVLAAIYALIMMRYGLLVAMVSSTITDFLNGIPRTLDFNLWYAGMGMVPLVLTGLIAIYAARVAVGPGRARPVQ